MSKTNAPTSVTGEQVEALTDEVTRLREELQVLRDVLSQIQDDVQWGIRNGILPSFDLGNRFRLSSMPLDPCADDFHERVNAVSDDDQHELRERQTKASDASDGHNLREDDNSEPRNQQALWGDDQ